MPVFGRITRAVNTGVLALLDAPGIGSLLGRGMTEIRYVGRRSGRTIRTPVSYSRSGDEVTIRVALPDRKTWWRNFLGEGGPLTLRLNGMERVGHAVATRDEAGRVAVRVLLTGLEGGAVE
ncbi:hypothetical protein [Nocardia bovistercoris]|uniref:DUF385 domain-containing protein n=1 Tax=Nocardia bovistercoris TaxID=2785916 RepID=A0A931IG24_9NOCA|nr:hypothetical protein [Nocardia bovistercoris]MBH0779908.1 hypothetical protein [Nocardia bovistercoris]